MFYKLSMPLFRTWVVTLMRELLPLPLSLSNHYPNVTSTLCPHSFPSIMRFGPTLTSAISHLVCPLRLLSDWVGDGQHMAHLWDRACPAESVGPLRFIEDV